MTGVEMKLIDDWKSLLLSPDRQIPIRKPVALHLTLAKLGFIIFVTSIITSAMGSSFGSPFLPTDNLLFNIVYSSITTLLWLLVLHGFAKALGGKGKYWDLADLLADCYLPLVAINIIIYAAFAISYLLGIIIGAPISIVLFFLFLRVAYKFLRLKYSLSQNRAIAALLGTFAIIGIIATALMLALMFNMLSSGAAAGAQPTITETTEGYHYYTPLRGGMSFDFSREWGVLQLANNSTAGNVMAAMMNNNIMSYVFLKRKDGLDVALTFQKSNANSLGFDCSVGDSSVQSLQATSAYGATWGALDGCVLKNMTSKNRRTPIAFMAAKCQDTNYAVVVLSGDDEQAVKEIVSTIRCGSAAVK